MHILQMASTRNQITLILLWWYFATTCLMHWRSWEIWKNALWWYLKRFGTVEKNVKTMSLSLKHALRWYLKLFGTAQNILKTMYLKNVFWLYLKWCGTADLFWKTMSRKHVFLTGFKTIGTCRTLLILKRNNIQVHTCT